MLTPFANSARALASGPLTWRTWAGLIVVPVLVAGLLTWAFWAPDTDHGTATAAVVNDDEPVTVNGQTVPLGRQLAGDLTHNADSAYTWVLTDSADATDGLASGAYTATVTIPKDFSARATSAATGKPLDATKAELRIRTSDAAGVADPALSTEVAEATQRTLNQQVVQTYLDNVYVAFGTIHERVGEGADGANRLATGTGKLRTGAKQVDDGAARLATAAGQLATGADELASGTGQLAAGSARLSSGLTQAERDTASLPQLTRQLADGAARVARGNEQLAATVVPLANRIIAAIDALPSARAAAAEFQRLADQCGPNGGGTAFCQRLDDAARRFARDADAIDGAKARIRAAAVEARDSVTALATGARQVANGNAQLAGSAGSLASGIASAASGARDLNDGIQRTDTGARQLSDGADRVAAGATDLSTGAGKVNTGAGQVDDGTKHLATELGKGRDQVPSYSDAERAHLKTVVADPSTATTDRTPVGTLAVTLAAALALWALALATYIVTRAVPDAVLTAREPTWRIIVRAALPGATAAALAALVITAIATPVLDLGVGRAFGFLTVALLAAAAFVALNQAVTAIFKWPGRLASLAVLVLTAATGVVSTLPGPLYTVAGYLPTHAATLALRAMITGGPGLLTGVTHLALWLAIGTFATILITDRRRYLTGRQLRRGAPLPATTT
jgi:putative membrane protein